MWCSNIYKGSTTGCLLLSNPVNSGQQAWPTSTCKGHGPPLIVSSVQGHHRESDAHKGIMAILQGGPCTLMTVFLSKVQMP